MEENDYYKVLDSFLVVYSHVWTMNIHTGSHGKRFSDTSTEHPQDAFVVVTQVVQNWMQYWLCFCDLGGTRPVFVLLY